MTSPVILWYDFCLHGIPSKIIPFPILLLFPFLRPGSLIPGGLGRLLPTFDFRGLGGWLWAPRWGTKFGGWMAQPSLGLVQSVIEVVYQC